MALVWCGLAKEMMEQFGADNIVEFYDVCTDTDIAELQEEERRAREAEKHRKRLNGGAFKRMGQQILGEIHDKHELFDDFSEDEDGELREHQLTEWHLPARIEKLYALMALRIKGKGLWQNNITPNDVALVIKPKK